MSSVYIYIYIYIYIYNSGEFECDDSVIMSWSVNIFIPRKKLNTPLLIRAKRFFLKFWLRQALTMSKVIRFSTISSFDEQRAESLKSNCR